MKRALLCAALLAACASLCAAIRVPVPPFPITCAIIRCANGKTCVDSATGPTCVSSSSPPPPPTDATPPAPADCSQLVCAPSEFCTETPGGPQCTPNTGCAAVTCMLGTRCVVTPTGPRCEPLSPAPTPQAPSAGDCACAQFFDPVCCRLQSGETKTTGNDCECSGCASGTVISRGACRPTSCDALDCEAGSSCVVKDAVAQCVEDELPCVCGLVFEPVCCQTPSGFETRSNSCFCECEPTNRVLRRGACPVIAPPTNPVIAPAPVPGDCLCADFYDPVCCESEQGVVSRASNSCHCECGGGTVVQSGCGINE